MILPPVQRLRRRLQCLLHIAKDEAALYRDSIVIGQLQCTLRLLELDLLVHARKDEVVRTLQTKAHRDTVRILERAEHLLRHIRDAELRPPPDVVRLNSFAELHDTLEVVRKELVRDKDVLDAVFLNEDIQLSKEIVKRTLAVVASARMEAERTLKGAGTARGHRNRMIFIDSKEICGISSNFSKAEPLVVGERNRV